MSKILSTRERLAKRGYFKNKCACKINKFYDYIFDNLSKPLSDYSEKEKTIIKETLRSFSYDVFDHKVEMKTLQCWTHYLNSLDTTQVIDKYQDSELLESVLSCYTSRVLDEISKMEIYDPDIPMFISQTFIDENISQLIKIIGKGNNLLLKTLRSSDIEFYEIQFIADLAVVDDKFNPDSIKKPLEYLLAERYLANGYLSKDLNPIASMSPKEYLSNEEELSTFERLNEGVFF